MDPNEALRLIRAYIAQLRVEDPVPAITGSPAFVQHARDLADTVEGLDAWLSRDGFLPADWESDDEKATRVADHPVHTECADGCGLDINHQGACLNKPGGHQVCEHEDEEN